MSLNLRGCVVLLGFGVLAGGCQYEQCDSRDAGCSPIGMLPWAYATTWICSRSYAAVTRPNFSNDVLVELQYQASLGSSASATVSTFASPNGYIGGVLAPSGKIYAIPYDATLVAVIDPEARTVTTIGSALGGTGGRYAGGVLASNGKIYGFPFDSTTLLEIDPATDTVRELGSLTGAGKWAGGVAAHTGRLYGVHAFSGSVLSVDPSGPTTSTVSGTGGGTGHVYEGAVLGTDGNAYWFPAEAATMRFAVFDSQSETIATFGSHSTEAYFSGALGPNGRIYAPPASGSRIVEINTDTRTVRTLASVAGNYVGAALSANGRIYAVPDSVNASTSFLEFDPSTEVTIERDTGVGNGWQGAVLGLNGKIYAMPLLASTVLEIDPKANGSICPALALSGYLNKF